MRVLWTWILVLLSAFVGAYAVVAGHGPVVLALVVALLPIALRWLTLLEYVVVSSPFMAYVSVGGPLHAAVSDAVIPFLALAVLASGELDAERQRGLRRIVGFCLVGVTIAVASGAWATLTPLGFDFLVGISNLAKLVIVLGYTCIVAAAVAAMPVQKTFRALRMWGWVAAALAGGSMLTSFAGVPLIPTSGTRSYGFFQDPNLYAGYLLISLAVVIARECYKGMRETPILLILISGGIIATASRSAAGTLAVMLVLAALLIRARRVRWTLIVLAVVGVWVIMGLMAAAPDLMSLPALDRLTTASEVASSDSRFGLWARAIELWQESPYLGIGIGQYQLHSADVFGTSGRTGNGFVAHNTFLSFLSETGVLGLGALLTGLVLMAKATFSLKPLGRRIDKAFLLGVIAVAAQMMTLNLQNVRYVWLLFGVILGLRLRLQARAGEAADGTEPAHSDAEPDAESDAEPEQVTRKQPAVPAPREPVGAGARRP